MISTYAWVVRIRRDTEVNWCRNDNRSTITEYDHQESIAESMQFAYDMMPLYMDARYVDVDAHSPTPPNAMHGYDVENEQKPKAPPEMQDMRTREKATKRRENATIKIDPKVVRRKRRPMQTMSQLVLFKNPLVLHSSSSCVRPMITVWAFPRSRTGRVIVKNVALRGCLCFSLPWCDGALVCGPPLIPTRPR